MQKILSIPYHPPLRLLGPTVLYANFNPFNQLGFYSLLLILLSAFVILPKKASSQKETNFLLPPLDTLVQLALKRSAKLQSQDVWIETQYQEWQLQKKSWADVISLGGTALFGNNTLLDNQQTSLGLEQVATARRSTVYNGGLIVRFTLGDVLNRDEKAHIKRLEYEQSTIDRRKLEDEIREEVMMRYDRFLANQRMVKLEADNVEALHLSFEVAKKYYEEGNYLTSEYSTILSRYITAQKQLEERKMEARHQYRMVLAIAGLI